jgi:hypothetical protein
LDGLDAPARKKQEAAKQPSEGAENARSHTNGEGLQKEHETDDTPIGDGDLPIKFLHVKAKRFLDKYGVTLEDLNQVLYLKGEELFPLYDDLKTTKASQSQIRVGLLQALMSGIKNGEFEFDGEAVRQECQDRKCYDPTNFSVNFKNNAVLFESFEKYDKQQPIIRLSDEGRKALEKAINELR